jgi:MOSC domain-containing protein YiiM
MKVVSVNVGLPKEIQTPDGFVRSGIFKTPVEGAVVLRSLNLDGDRQADLTVHGGPDKAVYAYPSEHYPLWHKELRTEELPWGAFGENLTVEGLLENEVAIGDCFRIGSAVLQVSQPRLPCFKLAAKFNREQVIKELLDSRRTGFYTRVLQEGSLQAGDTITLVSKDPRHITVREITDLYIRKSLERNEIERVLSLETLAASWREHFLRLLERN